MIWELRQLSYADRADADGRSNTTQADGDDEVGVGGGGGEGGGGLSRCPDREKLLSLPLTLQGHG